MGLAIQHETCAFQEPDYSSFARYGKAWPFIIPDGHILAFVSVGSASTSGILSFHRWVDQVDDQFSLNKEATCSTTWGADIRKGIGRSRDPWWDACMALPFAEWDKKYPQNQPTPDLNVCVARRNQHKYVRLFAIPFDAASGISDWKACAMTTGMGALGKDLKAIKEELSQLNRYTFDSDFWDGVTDIKDLIYSMEWAKPSYIGLTEAPPNNIMPR